MVKGLKSKALNKQKNKLRGLIAKAKSNAFVKGVNLDPSYIYCRGLKEIYLDSRTKLLPHEFERFLEWTEEQGRTVASDISSPKPGYGTLAGVISSGVSRCDLENELLWVTQVLKTKSSEINDFLNFSQEIEIHVLSKNTKQAIELIKSFDDKYGPSFYTHDIRVALESLDGGLEKQKSYVAKVRSKVKGGLLGFISYYVSIRNENKTTASKYKEDLNFRLEKHKYYDETVKNYLMFKLVGEVKEDEKFLSDVIFVEQSHSIFDLYGTYIKIIQIISQSKSLDHLKVVVKSCCQHLSNIDDYRVEKIVSKFNNSTPKLPKRNCSFSDDLISGSIIGSIKSWSKMPSADKADPWNVIYFSFMLSVVNYNHLKKDSQGPLSVPFLLSSLMSPSEDNSEYYLDKIEKAYLNFPCISYISGIYNFANEIVNKNPKEKYNFYNVGLNGRFHGIEDDIDNIENFSNSSITNSMWATLNTMNGNSNFDAPIPIINTFKSIAMFNSGNFDGISRLISITGRSKYESLWSINLGLLLSSYFNTNDNNNVIRTISTEGVKKKRLFPIYAIQDYLNSSDWMEYKNVDDPILSCVSIHLLWKSNESAETASLLRFAIRQCLRHKKVKLPSELLQLNRETPLRAWKYFFREVCRGQFIDQLLQGSNELLRERQKICASMSNIDYEFIDDYENEMADIASSLAIDNGKKIIDRTRIHVDTDSLKRWASKELIEDYTRYHDLLDVNVKASFENEFNEIFSDILNKGGGSTKWKSLNKDSEADMVFISLLARLSDEFLNSPEYGLDFYLSKRVRHQSFIGLIRGPLEFGNLITTKESTGVYNTNEHVLSKLGHLSEENLYIIDSELKKFSKKFDDLLENTKNSYLQINGPDNPKGLITFEIQEQIIFLLKMMTHKVSNFTDFIDVAVSVFWTSLSIPLSNVRKYISENLQKSVAILFDDLILNLKKSVKSTDKEFYCLILEIKDCSIEVQRELGIAAQWFSRSNTEDIAQSTFDANQLLDIAIDSTLKCHQSFHPDITKKVKNDADMLLDTSTLVFVHDVMFVALGNIYRHSGVENPRVSVTTEITDNTYSIRVVSDITPKNIQQKIDKLDEIRNLICERKFERRTRKEGGSGLLKIAAVALQDPLGNIDFYVEGDTFVLNVTYRVLMAAVPMERIHG